MSIAGQWNLNYNWGCSGPYSQTTLTFNNDGTFSTGTGNHGRWSQTNSNAIWKYDGDSAIYAGVVNGGALVGNMVNFSSSGAGCFYITRTGGAALVGAAATEAAEYDDTGAKKKK